MSRNVRGSYPHPVLDASDDVEGSFELFNVSFGPSTEDVEIKFQLRMTEPQLQFLIDEGRARYSFRWSCSSTIASGELSATAQMHHADSTTYVGWLDQEDVRRTVRVEVKIIATTTIERYKLSSQHKDYGDASFTVFAGDVLADAGFFDFEPDKLYDPLRPPVGSCFRFIADSRLKRGLRVKFHDEDRVLVVFPEGVLPGFGMLAEHRPLQIGLVVVPALMSAISFIKENQAAGADGEDLSSRKWYQVISRLVNEVGSFEDQPFELAQKILAHPLDSFLTMPFETLGAN